MKGTITTPKFFLECIHCRSKREVDIECEADIDTELLPWLQDGIIKAGEVEVKEGSTIPCICSRCAELGLPVPKNWSSIEVG